MTSDGGYVLRRDSLPDVPRDLLLDILAAANDLALVLSADQRVIRALAGPQTGLGDRVSRWHGQPIRKVLAPESWAKLSDRLSDLDTTAQPTHLVELTHQDGAGPQVPVRYTMSRTATGGEVLLVGRDLRPLAEVQQQLVRAQLALERDHESRRELETRCRVLLEQHAAPVIVVSVASGRIVDLNAAAAELIGAPRVDLVEASFAQEFEGRRRGELLDNLQKLAAPATAGGIELTVRRTKRRVQVLPMMFRAGGDQMLICRIDTAPGVRSPGDDLARLLDRMFHTGTDAIVFLDPDGVLRVANEAFLNLTDSANLGAVTGRSFADFLARGGVDLRVLLDNVRRVGHLRQYATRLNTSYDSQVAVEMSAAWLQDRGPLGIGLVIRQAALSAGAEAPAHLVGHDGLRNVMQLVGYSTLKEITDETTEIIERICIETALEMTGNNRVAAAELLSLSRQSLYVKLRKFGLLAKDAD